MGSNESACFHMKFNQSNELYFPGDQVSGEILFENRRDQLELENVLVQLVGELCYSTQESRSTTDSSGNSTTESYTSYHHIPFFNSGKPLARSDHQQTKMILQRGMHTWPFDFSLPEDLPPSSRPNPDAYPHIKYYVQIVFGRPWYKKNITKNYPVTISSYMNTFYMNNLQENLTFAGENRKKLSLQGYLFRKVITPDQSLSFQIKLHNPERTRIKKIEASFIQHRHASFDRRDDIICSIDLPGLNEFDESYFQRDFNLPMPSMDLTPTHTFSTTYQGYSYDFSVDYELVLKVKPHGIRTTFEVSVPVIIVPETTFKWQTHQQESYGATSISASAGLNDIDLPPSYAAVTRNKQ